MILLTVLIILFIILLLYKCRLFTEEKYTIGSLDIDWKNKAGVSGSVNKWIMVLYDDETGNKIHETEDNSPQNLQNFMDVNLKAIENKKFGSEILGTNTLSVYYNSISNDTKVYSGEFSLGTNDFSASSVSDISTKESNVPTWSDLTRKKDTLEEILGTEGTKIYVYPKDSTDDIYKFINRNACDINDPIWWVRKTCFILELGFEEEETGDIGYFYPYFPGLVETDHKYFGVNSTNKIVTVNETSRKKFYLEKPEGVTDTNTVKYGQFVYDNTNGDKYYMYVSTNDELKVAKLSDINNKSSTIFEFRYSKDCESYWTNLTETDDGKKIIGYNVFDCGPNDIHDCQYWGHTRRDAVGQGEACPSDTKVNGYVIKTQWPKETTISEMNTNYPTYLETTYANIIAENTDPNKNKTLVNTPEYYKNEYDTINASINANKAQEKEIINGIRYVWFGYEDSDYNRPLNIREIEVYSGNVNIVKGLSGDNVKSETGFYQDGNQFPPQQLFDQSTTNLNFGHTNNGKTNYFKIDLGKEYSVIDKVMVYNRTDCCQDRWASSFVKLLDDNGNEIVRSKETLPDDKIEARDYKEGNVRVKTFTFSEAATLEPTPTPTPTPISTSNKVVFHYGSFNSDYGDANVNAAAAAGHVYDNTSTGTTYGFGKITSRSTTNTETTYTWTPPPGTVTADVLIVAGGGGGGGIGGGGGGAGGLVFAPGESFSGEQTIVVGNGGEGGDGYNTSTQNGTPGSDSTCLTYTAKGGGGGGCYGSNTKSVVIKGGSGGGGGRLSSYTGGESIQDAYSGKGFGNDGGDSASWVVGGGGGGAGGAGGAGVYNYGPGNGGDGGIGKDYSSTFTTTYGDNGWFASGGGGGAMEHNSYDREQGKASAGGGTDGSEGDKADDAQPHTGGGGGGAAYISSTTEQRGGNGGSGVVIFIYGSPVSPPTVVLVESTLNTYKLYEYAFIMNKLSYKGSVSTEDYGLEIQWIKVDGVLLTSQKNSDDIYIKIDKEPKKDLDNMFVEDNNYAQWKKKSVINNPNGIELGDRVFTISKKNNKIEKIEISYYKPIYAPGWKITENSKLMIEESENRGSDKYSENVTYTYTIPDTAIKVDDTVSGGWSTWTGSNGETYFNASKMYSNWVNINSLSGMSATLAGAGRQLDLTLEQCKSLCEKEDECKSLEYIPMYTTSSCYSSPFTYCTLSKVLPTDENTKEWTRAEIHIKGSSS